MSRYVHYGVAATIARTTEENTAMDRAYIDQKITELVDARITPLDNQTVSIDNRITSEVSDINNTIADTHNTLDTKINDSVSTLSDSIDTKVNQDEFDTILTPTMAKITLS